MRRPELQALLTKARKGDIDLIFTKSISRFAHNAKVARDQNVYQRRYDKLATEHTHLLAEYEEIISRISDLEDQQAGYQHYKSKIEKLDPAELEFTPYLWHTIVDHATVNEHGVIAIAFRDGNEHATQPRRVQPVDIGILVV